MAERTWQESVLQVFDDLDSEAQGSQWKDFLTANGFDFNWPTPESPEAAKALEAAQILSRSFDMPSNVDWIFPGRPAQSVLYHLLASAEAAPHLPAPTQDQIETVENAVYAAQNFTVNAVHEYAAQLLPNCKKTPDGKTILRVVVFAYEYRASSGTPHGLYSDVCYARTGVARAGTVSLDYDRNLRSYPFTNTKNSFQLPVLPARYGAFLAASCDGSADFLGWYKQEGDTNRPFWIPIHKLFPGTDCLRGLQIELDFDALHVNEKLRRFHLYLQDNHIDTGWKIPDINQYPFISTQEIAEIGPDRGWLGSREVMPHEHEHLVKPAYYHEKLLTYRVPPVAAADFLSVLSSSLQLLPLADAPTNGECHPAPELLNVRHQQREDGVFENMNDKPDVVGRVTEGGYQARHLLDFTGDGWVRALPRWFMTSDALGDADGAQALLSALPCIAAYSLVAAPDFLPGAGQRAVKECFEEKLPAHLRQNVWNVPPDSLADQRNPPNLTLNQPPAAPGCATPYFDKSDQSVTAVVTMPFHSPPHARPARPSRERRSFLPDVAAGFFAPGWDVGLDLMEIAEEKVIHLAMYSLGSPFPTDSKLCAALSAFWPAAAPDTARVFQPTPDSPTIVPLTDQEIGLKGSVAWDGVDGPFLTGVNDYVDYPNLDYADYAVQAQSKGFYLQLLAEINAEEYVRRLLAMFRVYKALGVPVDQPADHTTLLNSKAEWAVLSFQRANAGDVRFQQAQWSQCAPVPFFNPQEIVYFFDVYQWASIPPPPNPVDACQDAQRPVDRCQVTMRKDQNGVPIRYQLFAGEKDILMRRETGGTWKIAPRVVGL